jgi:uncharacterized protein GlcG (DUF336 family)
MSAPFGLADARALIDRGLEKAGELGRLGAFVVVDEGGNVLSISRMDGAPAAAVDVTRAKAYLAAVSKERTKPFGDRMHHFFERWDGWRASVPEAIFPGPGGMPIVRDGRIVGAIATGPAVELPVDEAKVTIDGTRANTEDLVIAYALDIPYEDQHGPPIPPSH